MGATKNVMSYTGCEDEIVEIHERMCQVRLNTIEYDFFSVNARISECTLHKIYDIGWTGAEEYCLIQQ